MLLPGFEIQREIGRGGMARVYLAVQEKFGRRVALKVVSSEIAKDPTFRKRFLSESRINAQLTHPNIVQVHDVGAFDETLYLVMEYLAGGDLNAKLAQGMRVGALIEVVKDVGRALDYAHAKGFVHRDIKPENVLFREDGGAVITDFGIARVISAEPSMTRAGSVVGTPQYMSPEQAAGRELDGRSDLYSLGVVFYRMLTGDVPFKAETAVAVGIKHLQEPIPRLPNYLSAFQPVVDRALAKKPEHRFQTGAQLTAALEQVEAEDVVPNATIRTAAVTTQEIRAVGDTLLTTMRDPMRAERQPRAQRRPRRGRRSLVGALSVVLMLSIGLWAYRSPERVLDLLAAAGISFSPAVEEAWRQAEILRRDPNQGLATLVAGYRRVLSLDPAHEGAEQAIEGLADQWKRDIGLAITRGNLSVAETKLSESQVAFPEDSELDVLADRLTDARARRSSSRSRPPAMPIAKRPPRSRARLRSSRTSALGRVATCKL